MSAEIINLRKIRKQRVRDEKSATAERNRAKFGRPKAEHRRADQISQLEDRRLEGHRRDVRDGDRPIKGNGEDEA